MKKKKPIVRIMSFVTTLTIILSALTVSPVSAYTAGPFNPASGTNLEGIGTESWLDPEGITQPGGTLASVLLNQGHRYSNYLRGSQYNFSLPLDAAILGIQVEIAHMANKHNPNIYDNEVRLVKAGTPVGDNRASEINWSTTLTTTLYGGPTDLWGTTWSASEINSPEFGVVVAAFRDNQGNNDRYALVDSMQITVFYGYDSTTSVECGDGTPVMYGDNVTCVVTVTRSGGTQIPTGEVTWATDGSGSFNPNPCVLETAGEFSTCQVTYTPSAVGDGTHTITAAYSGNSYFNPSQAAVPLEVTPRLVTVTADPQTKVFGVPDPEFTFQITAGSLVFSDTFTGTLSRAPGEDVGTYPILQNTLDLSENYVLTYVGDNLTIIKADALCTVTPYSVVYDRNPHTATGSCTGLGGLPLDGLDLTGTIHTDVGTYTDQWTFTDVTGNYNNISGMITDTIAPVAITIAADPQTKLFGQPDPALTYKITSGALLPDDAVTGGLTREPGENVGTYAILQGTLSLPAYYNLTFVGADFTITGARILMPIIVR